MSLQSSDTTLPIVARDKRAILTGRTGSGKSTLACWLLNRSPNHWLILNPKWTKAYKDLPESETVEGLDVKKIGRSLEKNRFTIVNPSGSEARHDVMDDIINYYHESYEGIGLCADELLTLHNNGRAGSGLTGWLTRGRELKQSFLGITQRPAWISQFLFSEADYVACMSLNLKKDRQAVAEATGRLEMLEQLEARKWFWYDVVRDKLQRFGPVPPIRKGD